MRVNLGEGGVVTYAASSSVEEEDVMHQEREQGTKRPLDPIHQIYLIAEGIKHLAHTLPEKEIGLSYLLRLVSNDARNQAEKLDGDENSE